MTPDEVREFLIGWLMEFGDREVSTSVSDVYQSEWYMTAGLDVDDAIGEHDPDLDDLMIWRPDPVDHKEWLVSISPKGLDFIKGE